MKLIRLRNGDWVDPREIRSIRPLPICSSDSGIVDVHPPRLVVIYGSVGVTLDLELHEDPYQAADQLAELINKDK